MTNIKQLIITLVALFAISTGAWAQTIATIGTMCPPDATTIYNDNWKWVQCQPAITNGYIDVKMVNGALTADGFTPTATQLVNAFKECDLIILGEQGKVSTVQLLNASGEIVKELTVNKALDWSNKITIEPSQGLITGLAADYTIRINLSEYSLPLTPDATRKIWTLDKMPAGDVELQVEYYPGMLVKPTDLTGGTLSIEGLTDTTLPAGFEKDAEGNIYVKKDTKFTVKAVPAEGYHLVGWSDDATNKDLEREFTMTDDDFTVTATFSDEYDIAFQAANANTIESGKATVKVGTEQKTLGEDGKLSVKAGQTVTLNAATGYKFRKVKVKKAEVLTITVAKGSTDLSGDKLLYYTPGETYRQAIANHPENKLDGGLGWNIWENGNDATIFYKESADKSRDLSIDGDQHFRPTDSINLDTVIDPTLNFYFVAQF